MSTTSYAELLASPSPELRVVEVAPCPAGAVMVDDVEFPSGLTPLFDRVFSQLPGALAGSGAEFAGPPYALYTRMDGDSVDVQIGFPLAAGLDGPISSDDLEVVPSLLPGGEVMILSHLGPFDGLGATWQSFTEQIAASGREPGGPVWEWYVSDPTTTAPEDLRTDLFCLLSPGT